MSEKEVRDKDHGEGVRQKDETESPFKGEKGRQSKQPRTSEKEVRDKDHGEGVRQKGETKSPIKGDLGEPGAGGEKHGMVKEKRKPRRDNSQHDVDRKELVENGEEGRAEGRSEHHSSVKREVVSPKEKGAPIIEDDEGTQFGEVNKKRSPGSKLGADTRVKTPALNDDVGEKKEVKEERDQITRERDRREDRRKTGADRSSKAQEEAGGNKNTSENRRMVNASVQEDVKDDNLRGERGRRLMTGSTNGALYDAALAFFRITGMRYFAKLLVRQMETVKDKNRALKFYTPQRRGLYVTPQPYPLWIYPNDPLGLYKYILKIRQLQVCCTKEAGTSCCFDPPTRSSNSPCSACSPSRPPSLTLPYSSECIPRAPAPCPGSSHLICPKPSVSCLHHTYHRSSSMCLPRLSSSVCLPSLSSRMCLPSLSSRMCLPSLSSSSGWRPRCMCTNPCPQLRGSRWAGSCFVKRQYPPEITSSHQFKCPPCDLGEPRGLKEKSRSRREKKSRKGDRHLTHTRSHSTVPRSDPSRIRRTARSPSSSSTSRRRCGSWSTGSPMDADKSSLASTRRSFRRKSFRRRSSSRNLDKNPSGSFASLANKSHKDYPHGSGADWNPKSKRSEASSKSKNRLKKQEHLSKRGLAHRHRSPTLKTESQNISGKRSKSSSKHVTSCKSCVGSPGVCGTRAKTEPKIVPVVTCDCMPAKRENDPLKDLYSRVSHVDFSWATTAHNSSSTRSAVRCAPSRHRGFRSPCEDRSRGLAINVDSPIFMSKLKPLCEPLLCSSKWRRKAEDKTKRSRGEKRSNHPRRKPRHEEKKHSHTRSQGSTESSERKLREKRQRISPKVEDPRDKSFEPTVDKQRVSIICEPERKTMTRSKRDAENKRRACQKKFSDKMQRHLIEATTFKSSVPSKGPIEVTTGSGDSTICLNCGGELPMMMTRDATYTVQKSPPASIRHDETITRRMPSFSPNQLGSDQAPSQTSVGRTPSPKVAGETRVDWSSFATSTNTWRPATKSGDEDERRISMSQLPSRSRTSSKRRREKHQTPGAAVQGPQKSRSSVRPHSSDRAPDKAYGKEGQQSGVAKRSSSRVARRASKHTTKATSSKPAQKDTSRTPSRSSSRPVRKSGASSHSSSRALRKDTSHATSHLSARAVRKDTTQTASRSISRAVRKDTTYTPTRGPSDAIRKDTSRAPGRSRTEPPLSRYLKSSPIHAQARATSTSCLTSAMTQSRGHNRHTGWRSASGTKSGTRSPCSKCRTKSTRTRDLTTASSSWRCGDRTTAGVSSCTVFSSKRDSKVCGTTFKPAATAFPTVVSTTGLYSQRRCHHASGHSAPPDAYRYRFANIGQYSSAPTGWNSFGRFNMLSKYTVSTYSPATSGKRSIIRSRPMSSSVAGRILPGVPCFERKH